MRDDFREKLVASAAVTVGTVSSISSMMNSKGPTALPLQYSEMATAKTHSTASFGGKKNCERVGRASNTGS